MEDLELERAQGLLEDAMPEVKFTKTQNILGFIVSLLMKAIYPTLRWRDKGLYDSKSLHWSEDEPSIVVFWHSQQLFIPWIHRVLKNKSKQKPFYAIVSMHGDGRLCASLMEKLKIKTIAGSSTNGGRRAFTEMYKRIKSDNHIAITPDGPRGPLEEAKHGAIKLASLTGAKIRPVALNAKSKWVFNTWDSIFLPKPFSETLLIMGESFSVKENISKEELAIESKELTKKLKKLNLEVNSQLAIN